MKDLDKIIAVRFHEKDANLLKEIATDRGQDVSNFIRYSVRKELARLSYLSTKEKKALEINNEVKK